MPMKKTPTALIAVAALVGGWFVLHGSEHSTTVTADFAYINGVHPGSPVRILGVPVGTVTDITPRGNAVRVVMSITSDDAIAADAEAYVMNPSVISDRFVEIGPVYQGGEELGDSVIPVERSHSPINFDQLLDSVDVIATAVGPEGADLGAAAAELAETTDGTGPAVNEAIRNIAQATAVIGGNSENIGALVETVNQLITAVDRRDGAVESVVDSLDRLGQEFRTQDLDVGTPIAQLTSMFDELDRLLAGRGDDLRAALDNAADLTGRLATHEAQFAELMDVLPLAMQNIGRTIGDDQRGRIRLNVSTDLDQFASTVPLCRDLALPICTGAGFTNPIPVPIGASDPLGLIQLLAQGR
jgi:phospholipid/cholesterol/gamma-HCH transport system substrate-binding protein